MQLARTLLVFALGALATSEAPAQTAKMPRIGVMANTVPTQELLNGTSKHPAIVALLQGLRERGWEPGKNVEMVWRSAENEYDRQPQQARELAATSDVIVVYGHTGLDAAMAATKSVPIVMAASFITGPLKDQSGTVRVASFAKPGGNVTGLTLEGDAQITAKRFELLKLAAPHIRKVGLLIYEVPAGGPRWGPQMRRIAETFSLEFSAYGYQGSLSRLEQAFEEMARDQVHGVFVRSWASGHLPEVQKEMHRLAERHRMPVMHEVLNAADTGGLMSYGHDIDKLYKRAGHFIDRILRGTKPGDIPIEQPSDYELRVNLKAAKAIGLTLPQSILLQATRVIE